ncbi:MAG: GNAT family N-acetyltransferase [Christensenellales bacterium]
MKIEIRQIEHAEEKRTICRAILEALPEWFGIPEAREEYIRESTDRLFFAAMDGEKTVGFLYLKETGRDTVELYAMGVLKARHRTGVGRALVEAARRAAREAGYAFMQVKTVQMGKYAEYDATNRFYLAMGSRSSRYSRTCGTNGTVSGVCDGAVTKEK